MLTTIEGSLRSNNLLMYTPVVGGGARVALGAMHVAGTTVNSLLGRDVTHGITYGLKAILQGVFEFLGAGVITYLWKQWSDSAAQIETLTGERDTARADLVTRTDERDTARADLATRTDERDAANAALETATAKIQELDGGDVHQRCTKVASHLRNRLQADAAEMAKLSAKLGALEETQAQLAEATATIGRLQREARDVRNAARENSEPRKVAELKAEVAVLRGQLDAKAREVAKATEDLTNAQLRVAALRRKNDRMETLIRRQDAALQKVAEFAKVNGNLMETGA